MILRLTLAVLSLQLYHVICAGKGNRGLLLKAKNAENLQVRRLDLSSKTNRVLEASTRDLGVGSVKSVFKRVRDVSQTAVHGLNNGMESECDAAAGPGKGKGKVKRRCQKAQENQMMEVPGALGGGHVCNMSLHFLETMMFDTVRPDDACAHISSADLCAAINSTGEFETCETDQKITTQDVTELSRRFLAFSNDPDVGSQYSIAEANTDGAWKIATGNAADPVIVAVIDSGVLLDHPDLKASLWVNPNEIAGNGIDDDGNGYIDDVHGWNVLDEDGNPNDDNGHGTHVAGIIAAQINNAVGIAGVAQSNYVRVMALKVLDKDGAGWISDALVGFDYALAMGARVSCNSWGGELQENEMTAYTESLETALEAGHLVVAAAGNAGNDNDIVASKPCSMENAIIACVASTDKDDSLSYFSNYGITAVDVAAPGSDILSSDITDTGYNYRSGTSMAAPYVAGIAAMMFATNPNLGPAEAKLIIMNTSDARVSLQGKVVSGGRANTCNAVATAGGLDPLVACADPVPVAVVTADPGEENQEIVVMIGALCAILLICICIVLCLVCKKAPEAPEDPAGPRGQLNARKKNMLIATRDIQIDFDDEGPKQAVRTASVPLPIVQYAAGMQVSFDQLDTNHDGVVSRAEFEAAMRPQVSFQPPMLQPLSTTYQQPLSTTYQAPVLTTYAVPQPMFAPLQTTYAVPQPMLAPVQVTAVPVAQAGPPGSRWY